MKHFGIRTLVPEKCLNHKTTTRHQNRAPQKVAAHLFWLVHGTACPSWIAMFSYQPWGVTARGCTPAAVKGPAHEPPGTVPQVPGNARKDQGPDGPCRRSVTSPRVHQRIRGRARPPPNRPVIPLSCSNSRITTTERTRRVQVLFCRATAALRRRNHILRAPWAPFRRPPTAGGEAGLLTHGWRGPGWPD